MSGNALVSAFIQDILDNLDSPQVLDFFRGRKLDETLLNKLKVLLLSVDAMADDAELKQFSDRAVGDWLFEVNGAVLDAENLLNEIHSELSNYEVEAESESKTSTFTVPNSFNATFYSFNREIASGMRQVIEKLEYLLSLKDVLGLQVVAYSGVGPDSKVSQKMPTMPIENVIYGRDDDKEMIIDLLTSDTDNRSHLSIVSIVGLGGVGKTTLAQLVYNDRRMVEDKFDIKAWVRVGDDFDVFELTRSILVAFTGSEDVSEQHLEMLRQKLKEKLTGKKFFLVLDDVWNEVQEKWEAVQTSLKYGVPGSAVLVTTRSEKVASMMWSTALHRLEQSSLDNSWFLFSAYAFQDDNPHSHTDLFEIGKKIVKKCQGLPLILKTIGSLLSTKLSASEWERVLRSEIWDIPEHAVTRGLLLSYYHLPSHLKRCFAYCSLFPRGYEFVKQDIILLWMAENFLPCQQSRSLEEVGEQYFNDLLWRSFFQQSIRGGACFVIHDLLHDLAKFVSSGISYELQVEIPRKSTRHFSFSIDHTIDGLESLYDAKRLHTFMPIRTGTNSWFCKMSIGELCSRFKFLHVLSLSWCFSLTVVPDSIGNLKHLRSLDLSNTGIIELPDSTCFLSNLQILKLNYCNNLEELPSNLHKLINLRYLEFVGTKLIEVPPSVSNLMHLGSLVLSSTSDNNLQILKLSFCANLEKLPLNLHKLVDLPHLESIGTKLEKVPVQLGEVKNLKASRSFYVRKSSESSIEQLQEVNLHGELSIGELWNIVNPSDAISVNLKNNTQLVELELEWNRTWNQSLIPDDSWKEKEVFENVQPSKHLKKLSIINYGGTQFPLWLFNNSLSDMVFLRLDNCKYCQCLPPLGLLPSLKHLTITGLDGIVGIYAYFYGSNSSPFKSLQTLEFSNMKEWKEWESDRMTCVFPCLQRLSIQKCPKLNGHLPKQIPNLKKLIIHDCKQLVASAPTALAISDVDLQDCGELQFDYHPTNLKRLIVSGHSMEASMLETVGHVICHTSLEFLLIDSSPSMNIPISPCYGFLEKLEISDGCDSLVIFPLDLFPKLCQLKLRCPNLQMISQSHTHNHLKDMEISECRQFESLPKHLHTLLPFLDSLHINDCPKVKPILDGGLPSNLTRMNLSNCYNLIASLKKAVGTNTCLRTLSIGKLHLKSFPDEDFLPISLKVLQIRSCLWLEKLDYKGLCQLSSLEELILDDCPRLQCLPEEGLPRSISTLRISSYCLLLKQQCLEPESEYWGKIAHIENILVGDEPIR